MIYTCANYNIVDICGICSTKLTIVYLFPPNVLFCNNHLYSDSISTRLLFKYCEKIIIRIFTIRNKRDIASNMCQIQLRTITIIAEWYSLVRPTMTFFMNILRWIRKYFKDNSLRKNSWYLNHFSYLV